MIIEKIDEKTGEVTQEEINALFFDKCFLDNERFRFSHDDREITAYYPKNLFQELEKEANPELYAKIVLNRYATIRDYLKLAADEMYDSKKIQYLETLQINK